MGEPRPWRASLWPALAAMAALWVSGSGCHLTLDPDAYGTEADVDGSVPDPDGGVSDPDGSAVESCNDSDRIQEQLLANPGFESGPTAWQESSGLQDCDGNIICRESDTPVDADSGTYLAWLGGVNNTTFVLSQSVDVPASASGLRLIFHRCFDSSEPLSSGADDTLDIELQPGGGRAELLATFDNNDESCIWRRVELPADSPYAGQRVELRFRAVNDPLSPTSFWIDSLALEANVCP